MDRAERNELVEKNIGLVHACANKFRGKGAEYDDLFQAGCVGLIKAAENFDPERGFSFSTYAVPVILGEIKRIFRDGGSVKVGRALKEKARAAMREKDALTRRTWLRTDCRSARRTPRQRRCPDGAAAKCRHARRVPDRLHR